MVKAVQGIARLSIAIALSVLSAFADGASWIRVSNGSLSVFTQGDANEAASLLLGFAQLRTALAQASIFHVNEGVPLKVVAFHSEKQFNQYRLSAGSCAFYQQTARGDYVVLQTLASNHHEVSSHEFTHFVVAHSGVTLPLWLNEGIADYYSTYQVSGERVTFGRSVPMRLHTLRGRVWLPLADLFQVTTSSPYYSDPDRMLLFYSQSWALTHMLVSSPAYAGHFRNFINALNSGHTGAESARMVFNKTPEQLEMDLHDYLDQQHLPLTEEQLKSPPDSLTALTNNVLSAEMDVTLADLMPNNAQTQAEAESRLTAASGQMPTKAEAEESLGYLALRQGKTADARAHFQQAIDRHSSDPNVFFYLGHLNHEAGLPSQQVIPLLEQALTLKPDLGDARLELALVATSDGDFNKALKALQNLTAPRPENAYAAVYTEAYCYAHLERFREAQAVAGRAKSLAANDRDRAEVGELVEFIQQQQQDLVPDAGSSPPHP